MLLELHVKNLALIEQARVEFSEGLNILTGETGAGKSIIIGSVNLALGQKASREMIRTGAEYAYVELIFSVAPDKRKALEAMDIIPDQDGIIVISRKIMTTRSISKINDETVTIGTLKKVTGLLIDIHGQHEHQSLLYPSKHLEILDTYAKTRTDQLKKKIADQYSRYQELRTQLAEAIADQDERIREMDFLKFEIDEIETAALQEGEEETLTEEYRRYNAGKKIIECLSESHAALELEGVSRAIQRLGEVASFDARLQAILDQMYDVESIIHDVNHEISSYMDSVSFDEAELMQMEERLDLIHNLQAKYGATIEQIDRALEGKQKRLEQLEHYDEYLQMTKQELEQTTQTLEAFSSELSKERKKAARSLTKAIASGLHDLNFLDVSFDMNFGRLTHYTANGFDEAEFVISTNPGEPMRALQTVASGGELSRIMLAIKTVLADSDDIPTLIFDEIDTGISGRTAQMVSEKLAIIAGSHQVICITHLPQIAAMADCHFEIRKMVNEGKTITLIERLDDQQMITELARLLGGAKITDAVRQNAREMKELASKK
ncbi:MAG: DNA repair protein RecN [Lachnospiraceae bacterium]